MDGNHYRREQTIRAGKSRRGVDPSNAMFTQQVAPYGVGQLLSRATRRFYFGAVRRVDGSSTA
jgi:hypothetical protein